MPQLTAELILRAYSLGIFPMANGRDGTRQVDDRDAFRIVHVPRATIGVGDRGL